MITDDLDSQHMSVQVTLDGVSQAYYHNSVMDGTIKTGAILVNRDDLAGGPHTLTIDVYAESIFMVCLELRWDKAVLLMFYSWIS